MVKGTPATGTVTLNVGAPSNLQVSLKTSDAAVAGSVDPWVVSFTQGEVSKTFQITTSSLITADAKVVISATYGNVTKSETLTVTTTPRLSLVSVSPRTVHGGSSATGTVTLTGLSSGTSTVTLTSSAPAVASVPASVGVVNGLSSAMFTVTTFSVTSSQAVTITATYAGVSRWASVTVVPFTVQGAGTPEYWLGSVSQVPGLHLASLTLGSGTSGLFGGSIGKRNFDSLGDEGFSLGLPNDFGEGDGGLRPMDGPIYSVPGPTKRNFIYSPEMNLLAESEVSSPRNRQILYEYIWVNGHPVAQVDGQTVTHWTFTDHLGTPTIQTDAAGAVFWRAEYEPYGKVFALRTGDQHQPLRLPGQEAEQFNLGTNGLTERFYNVFRWYRPNWGRYTQPDPFARWKAASAYDYADDNPIIQSDPLGLFVVKDCRRATAFVQTVVTSVLNRILSCFPCGTAGGSGPPSPSGQGGRLFTALNNATIHCGTPNPSTCGESTGTDIYLNWHSTGHRWAVEA